MGSILRTCKPTRDISAQGNSHGYRVHSYESHGKNIMYILNKVTNYQMILKFRKTGTVWKIKKDGKAILPFDAIFLYETARTSHDSFLHINFERR